jgi:nucleoside 2-deoxyribosyltransferase
MRSVAVCASKKYASDVHEFCRQLEAKGVMVFEPNFKEPLEESAMVGSEHMTKIIFKGLTLEHFDWIRKADVCYVLNVDNYVGASVTMEMAYACALGKPVFALNQETGDPCRNALIDKVVPTAADLMKLL